MTEIEKNLSFINNKDNEECKMKCNHELSDENELKDENEHLTVIDSVSVYIELEQLFNDFNIYNHHIKIFKKLLNLKEFKNQYNFFAFNQRNDVKNQTSQQQSNETVNLSTKLSSSNLTFKNSISNIESLKENNQLNDNLTNNLKIFKGGELSAMQVHSQLNKIKEQFKESQLLVTCLIHNIQRLRKNYCGKVVDLVSSSELLASLEKDHSNLKTCKSIFKYQCSEKRKQLNKLKQQLKQAQDDWNQLIVKEPKITKLTNEEILLLNKSQKKRKSIDNQLNKQINNQMNNNELNNKLEKLDNLNEKEQQSSSPLVSEAEENSTNSSSDLLINNPKQLDQNQSNAGESNCDSAVHSESEADSLQFNELATAIFRRKSKLDRLERECYSFMSRLANRNKQQINSTDEDNKQEEELNNKYADGDLVIDEDELDNFNDEYDEDLLDEEYDDVEFDDEIVINDAFVEADIENLINRFSSVEIDNNELINQNLLVEEDEEEIIENISNLTNDQEQNNMINEEVHSFSDDYLIGHQQTRNINSSLITDNYLNNIINNDEQSLNNTEINLDNNLETNINNEISASSSNQDELDNNDLLDISKNTNLNETLANTGEPLALCRLRRQAVRILASRIRTEKEYYEVKENELCNKLDLLHIKNLELEKQLEQFKNRPPKQLLLISTAFVFCSLIGYFLNNY